MKRIVYFSFSVLILSCSTGEQPKKPEKKVKLNSGKKVEKQDLLTRSRNYFQPLPEFEYGKNGITEAKVSLGKKLYFDKRLSKNGTISCNSCHNLETFGVDNLPTSPGDEGKKGDRNSPTVLNAALHFAQFWDGRSKDVEEQAGMPILNPVEMNIPSEEFLVERLKSLPEYKTAFNKAYPESGITYANLSNAIGAFERTLITPTRFDDFLRGNPDALSAAEKNGLELFINTGCITCHTGPTVGGTMYQKFGLFGNYWEHTKSKVIDEGRFKETQNESDKYFFKVPGLRNIEKTHPYFHDGSVTDLKEAVKIMATVQNNKELSDQEAEAIITFLKTLTGEVPKGALAMK
jgi:cytochrome c peroxidase